MKIKSAEPSKYTKGCLDSIKSNRDGGIWKLKTGRTTKSTDTI